MFKPKVNSEMTEKKQSPQSKFTEESIREGFTLEDIKLWQNLCRALALLGDDAEEAMHGVLSICDVHHLNPLTVCATIRSLGFPSVEKGIESAFEHYGLGGDDDDYDEHGDRTTGDTPRDYYDPDADEDDRVEGEGDEAASSTTDWKRQRHATAVDEDEE